MSALCTFASNKLIINREKRVDASTFYIHCRQHLMLAAVFFYVIGRAFIGHREDRFCVAPTIFSLSLWHRTLPAHRLLHLHMYDSVDSANKSAMCRWQCIHKPGLYTLHNYLKINRIQTKVQSALKSRIPMSTFSLSAYRNPLQGVWSRKFNMTCSGDGASH